MSVTSFLHLSETVGEFDLKTFCEAIQKKYPGTDTEQRQSKSLAYDITWSRYADCPQFELRLDRTRRTFAVEYFNSEDRISGITPICFYGSGSTFRRNKKWFW